MTTRFKVIASYNILQYLCDFIHVLIFVIVSKCRKSPKLTNIVILAPSGHVTTCNLVAVDRTIQSEGVSVVSLLSQFVSSMSGFCLGFCCVVLVKWGSRGRRGLCVSCPKEEREALRVEKVRVKTYIIGPKIDS
jgi:hypothetical protein